MDQLIICRNTKNLEAVTGINEVELKAILKIVKVYKQLLTDCSKLTVGQSLPPIQVDAVENKIQEILLLY